MFTALIAFIMLIVGLVTGYTLHPRISRKISYKKRGQAAKKRAYVKREAKTVAVKVNKLNGSAELKAQTPQDAVAQNGAGYANGDNYDR